jgi:cyclopropane fatty-acyl-phospholipid synthase-like methyltransferase
MRFDALYQRNPDPWAFRSSAYEHAKYSATLAALPRHRYRIGIEVGCSIGELTVRLAPRCDFVLGVDVSAVAIDEAKRTHGERPDMAFIVAEVPAFWPGLRADLIVLSELLYFLTAAEIRQLAGQVAEHWIDGGDCVLVNYLGPTDTAVDGDNAAERFIRALARLRPISTLTAERVNGYRLDVLRAGHRESQR